MAKGAVASEDDAVALGTEFEALLDELAPEPSAAERRLLRQAYEVAFAAHDGQRRKSGEPYLVHPLAVTRTIARMGLGVPSVAAGLMHDAVEDSDLTVVELTERFGREIATLVDGVTKLGKVPYLSRRENQAESFRKMLVAMSRDIRVLLVKLADRLDNMRTLESMPPVKRERIARETMEIYAPLASRLGIDWLRTELQDLAFAHTEPGEYAELRARMNDALTASPTFIDRTLEALRVTFSPDAAPPLDEDDRRRVGTTPWHESVFGPVELRAVVRTPWAVRERLAAREDEGEVRPFDVSDLVTYQVITLGRDGCYAALGRLHAAFTPAPGKFRDYVALPRPNRYQALHSTVVDARGARLEVQIRSDGMDAVAERGIVVDLQAGKMPEEVKLSWLGSVMDWEHEVADPNEFIEAVKADLFADEVYVFTPGGDLRTFPKGATPIDFGFAIHTDVGMRTSGARVNGQVVPLRYRLRQGDTVEIITDRKGAPRSEWMQLAVTSRARTKIRQHLRQVERERLIQTGRSLLDRSHPGLSSTLDELAQDELIAALDRMSVARERGRDAVFEDVGAGRLAEDDVVRAFLPGAERHSDERSDAPRGILARLLRRMSGQNERGQQLESGDASSPIVVDRDRVAAGSGIIRLSECCSPVVGDPLAGFVVPSVGIVAHVQECPNAQERQERRVFLTWEEGLNLDRPVTLQVRTANKVGLLAEMSRAFSSHGVNIKEANCRAYDDGRRAINTFHATVRNLGQVRDLVETLRRTRGVIGVERMLAPVDA